LDLHKILGKEKDIIPNIPKWWFDGDLPSYNPEKITKTTNPRRPQKLDAKTLKNRY